MRGALPPEALAKEPGKQRPLFSFMHLRTLLTAKTFHPLPNT
jgi:hypothetical protein